MYEKKPSKGKRLWKKDLMHLEILIEMYLIQ